MLNYTDPTENKKKPDWLVQGVGDLSRHEGYREFAYPDPLSKLFKRHPNEKWGFQPAELIMARLGERAADGTPWTCGFGFTKGVGPGTRMSLAFATKRLEDEVVDHAHDLDRLIPSWNVMPLFAQSVLVDIIYNLGYDRLRKFVNTLDAFKNHDWTEAANGLRNSIWFKQVGARGKELVARLENKEIAPANRVI